MSSYFHPRSRRRARLCKAYAVRPHRVEVVEQRIGQLWRANAAQLLHVVDVREKHRLHPSPQGEARASRQGTAREQHVLHSRNILTRVRGFKPCLARQITGNNWGAWLTAS